MPWHHLFVDADEINCVIVSGIYLLYIYTYLPNDDPLEWRNSPLGLMKIIFKSLIQKLENFKDKNSPFLDYTDNKY